MSRRPKPVATVSLSMEASRWKFITDYGSNVNMPASPTQESVDSWRYHFPLAPGKVGYLLCPHTAKITAGSITGEFELIGDGVVQDAKEPWGTVCTARFILYRDLTTARGRWWCRAGIDLNVQRLGTVRLTVPLTPDQWTGPAGESAVDYLADFQACLNAPTHLGITHGAGDHGHGVNLQSGALTAVARGIKLI